MKTDKTKLEKYVSDNLMSKPGLPDERQLKQTSNAFMTGLAFAMLFDIAMMICYFVKHETEKAYPYLAQLLVICGGFCIASMGNKDPGLPMTLWGRSIPVEKTGSAFAKRLLHCIIEAAAFSAALMAFNIYDGGKFGSSMIIETLLSFLIFTGIEVLICEFRVKRYRKAQEKLDQEENDLED